MENERPRTRPHGLMKAVLVLSGGQDSTTCGFWAKSMGVDEIHAITFDYNQRHKKEIDAARKVAELMGVTSHEVVTLGPILKGASPLISDNFLEQYKDHRSLPGGLERTFVPMRNQLFLTIAANRAYVLECEALITGVSAEDYGGYPDCRQPFIHTVQHACNLGAFTGEAGAPKSLAILTPLMHKTKRETVEMAIEFDGCYHALAYSHTSYDGYYPPTGKDHATLLRAKGFEEAHIPDPLILRAWIEGRMPLPDTENYRTEKVNYFITKYLESICP